MTITTVVRVVLKGRLFLRMGETLVFLFTGKNCQ